MDVGQPGLNCQGQTPGDGAPGLRVLLVDDHEDMLAMMQLLLSQRSYTVATANSAKEALQVAGSFDPHVVVSDITMPDMDGCEMMSTLRSQYEAGSFRAIAISGFDGEEHEARALAAGFDAHFTKPVDFDELFKLIDVLGKK